MSLQILKNIFLLILVVAFMLLLMLVKIKSSELAKEKLINKQLVAQIEAQNQSIQKWQADAATLQEKLNKAAKEATRAVKNGERQSDTIMAEKPPRACADLFKWMAEKATEIQK